MKSQGKYLDVGKSGKIFGCGKVREKSRDLGMNARNIFLLQSTPFCSSF